VGIGGASGSRAALHVVAGGSGSGADLSSSVGGGAAGGGSAHLEGREGSDNRDESDGEEGLEAEHVDRLRIELRDCWWMTMRRGSYLLHILIPSPVILTYTVPYDEEAAVEAA
jgi:hypothetical protein